MCSPSVRGGWWTCFGRAFGWLVCQWVGWFVRTDCRCFGQSVSQTCGSVFQFLGLSLWLLIGCWVVGQSVVWAVVSVSESFGWFVVGMIGFSVVNKLCV